MKVVVAEKEPHTKACTFVQGLRLGVLLGAAGTCLGSWMKVINCFPFFVQFEFAYCKYYSTKDMYSEQRVQIHY